uniref:Cytohesin 1 interacting protein n=1 Tax=Nothobranchius furzeri TaxID=105023 RepID=A0A8C6PXK7_NOTFU
MQNKLHLNTMNFNGLQRESSQEVQENSLKKKPLWYRRSLRGNTDRHRQNAGTQPRACKPKPTTTSLVDYSDPQRTSTVLEKHDNETFGFEIQTYGLKQKTSSAVEMCTFISKVKEDSVAESAGLTAGDVIITVNGVSIEGLSHELQLCFVFSGNLNNRSLDLLMEAQAALNSPVVCHGRRFSSDSSYKSGMTDDSDQASVFGELSSPSPGSAISTTDDGCFFSRDFPTQDASKRLSSSSLHHQALSRSSSSSLAGSNTSLSPSWDETRISSLFGTLPRKSRRGTVRQQIFKLIPALQRSVEEEEMATPTQ